MIITPVNKIVNFATAVPSSKSYTNRALILAALAKGKSMIINPLESDDTLQMIAALKQLGIKTVYKQKQNNKNRYHNTQHKDVQNNYTDNLKYPYNNKILRNQSDIKTVIEVIGNGGKFKRPTKTIFLGNAGTAVRFLTATLASQPFESRLTGNERMQERPIGDLIDALTGWGAKIESKTGCPPLKIKGPLKGGPTKVNGSISSQYLSALLIAAPYTLEKSEIMVKGRLTSLPYVKMTLDTIKKFGGTIAAVKTTNKSYNKFNCAPHKYRGTEYEVEGDASSASYPWAIAAVTGGSATVTNVPADSAQADLEFLKVLKKMGCKVDFDGTGKGRTDNRGNSIKGITVKGPTKLKALGEIDLNNMPDAAMTVAVLCAFADGKSRLTGLGNLRVKETDRLKALETELKKTGVKVRTGKDWIEVGEEKPCKTETRTPAKHIFTPHGAEIETYNDHRMAMCFAVMGVKVPGIVIKNPRCVSKTYPDFFKDLKKWLNTTS